MIKVNLSNRLPEEKEEFIEVRINKEKAIELGLI